MTLAVRRVPDGYDDGVLFGKREQEGREAYALHKAFDLYLQPFSPQVLGL